MSTISELVELLKEGSISKDQMLEIIHSNSFTSKPPEKSARFEKTADRETEVEFNTLDFDDFQMRPTPVFETSFSVLNSDGFIERQVNWDTKRSINQELKREQKMKIEEKECTFQPKTNANVSSGFSQETIERLAKCRENVRIIRMREEQERRKLEEELLPCTFHPQINKNSCISGSKYLADTPKRNLNNEEPTFIPKVKGPCKGMKIAKEYVKQDPFERLSRPKEMTQPEPEDDSPKSIKPLTPNPEYSGISFSTKPFFERQALYELMKLEKKEILESMPLPQPVINERSKKLVKKDFYQRNQEMIEKKSETKPDPNPCSFQPKITNMAKMRRNRSFAEMSYGDLKKRNEKVEVLKEMAEEKVREQTNYSSFQSRSYTNVKSKLQILDDPQSYIERIKSEQRKKEIVSQIMQ